MPTKKTKKSKTMKVVYAPYSHTEIKAEDILAEVGFIFSVNSRGGLHVSTPWHLGDRDHWVGMERIKVARRNKFMRRFVKECYKLAKKMVKEYKAEKVTGNPKGKKGGK